MNLLQRVKRVSEFLAPNLLAKTDLHYEPAPGDIQLPTDLALLVIDVQKEFCDPKGYRGNEETAEVSRRISSLVPEFRKAGIPVYMIYFSYEEKKAKDIDFYEVRPEKGDVLVAKNRDSAFQGSKIANILQKAGHSKLLTCGFNLNACVFSTVMDAKQNGFEVTLLRDLVGNDNCNDKRETENRLRDMQQKGVALDQSAQVLKQLHAPNAANASRAPANI